MEPPKTIKTEGDLAMAQAAALRQKAPEIAAEVERVNQIELNLVAKEIDRGTTPQAVIIAAEHEGAGVSPAPAIIGGSLGCSSTGSYGEEGMTEEDFAELARVREMRNAMLFEEPCPLFEEEELHG